MDDFQFQKCCNQNTFFLFIKVVMKRLFLYTVFIKDCITKPVDKNVKMVIFTDTALSRFSLVVAMSTRRMKL